MPKFVKRKPIGRPPISDHAWIYMTVEYGRRRRSESIRQFCARGTSKLERVSVLPSGETRITIISKETLRRRYSEALKKLGLYELPPGYSSEGHDAMQIKIRGLLDGMIEGIYG